MVAKESLLLQEFEPLNTSTIIIRENNFGSLDLEIKDKASYDNIKPVRIFPYTYKEKFILLKNEEKEIGIIEDINELEEESRLVLNDELEKVYYIPVIKKVINIEYRMRTPVWSVETDKGVVTFELTSRTDAKFIGSNHLVIKDSYGARYEVEDFNGLDKRSKDLIEREV